MTKDKKIKLLEENVRQLQEQLTAAYIRIKELTDKETTPVDRHYKMVPDGTGHGPAMVDIDDEWAEPDQGWSDEIDIQIMSTSRGHNQ